MMKKTIFFVIVLCCSIASAFAQAPNTGRVVSSCGTPGITYTAGAFGPMTVDTSGNLCFNGSGGGATTVNVTQWASGTLGAMANYGTSPGAVLVPGVNAFVTNSVAVTGTFWPYTLGQQLAAASVPVVLTAAQLATLTPPAAGGAVNVTPTDCSGTITSGGTAQNAIAANAALHGFTLANIDASAGSGEPLWLSLTTTAAASTGASYPLAAPTATSFAGLSSYTTPLGFGTNHAVSIIGATTGHKFSCTYW
jgi:hypothetical protein